MLDPRRLGRITSSTAAACLGLDRWSDPLGAWEQIMGKHKKEQTKQMRRGILLEPALMQFAHDELGGEITRPGFVTHPAHGDWLGDSIDGVIRLPNNAMVGVEGKTAGARVADEWGEEGTDNVPKGCLVQCHVHLSCHPDLSRIAVPMLGGWGMEFGMYWVNRNPEIEGNLLQQLEKWHRDHIVGEKPPPATEKSEDTLRRMHPEDDGKVLEDCLEMERWAREKAEAMALKSAHETEEEFAKNRIRALLGDKESCRGDWGSVTNRNTKDRTAVNWEAIAKAMEPSEELIQKHTTVARGARTLRVTHRGEA